MGPALVVLLPGFRVVVLSIKSGAAESGAKPGFAAACQSRGVPLARVSSVEDVCAVLRRFGVEPEEC